MGLIMVLFSVMHGIGDISFIQVDHIIFLYLCTPSTELTLVFCVRVL